MTTDHQPHKTGPILTAKLTQLDLPDSECDQDGYLDYFKEIIEPNIEAFKAK